MDVRISYGINIDKVPEKVHELLNNASGDVSKLLETFDLILQLMEMDKENMEMAYKLLDQLRVKLASIDRVANDSQMILKGYLEATKPKSTQAQPSPSTGYQDTTPPSAAAPVRKPEPDNAD